MPGNVIDVIDQERRDENDSYGRAPAGGAVTARCPAGTNGASSNAGRNSF